MEQSFKTALGQAKSVLILLPQNPYFDQVAAGLSLYLALKDSKDVSISCPAPMVVEFNRLVGVDRVTSELGNKNLVVQFSDYDPENIERVSYDIEDKQFRLKVIPKPQVAPPNKDQVIVTYSGVSADTVILIGGINDTHFPALGTTELSQSRIIHIGTQEFSSSSKKNIISLSRPASSVSELVATYIKQLEGTKLSGDIASNLLAGVHEGTRNFTHSQVNSDTFKLVAELMEAGGHYTPRADRGPRMTRSHMPLQRPAFRPQPPRAIETTQENSVSEETKVVVEAKPQPEEKPVTDSDDKSDNQNEEDVDAPESWLQPKIYKGTSTK